MSRLTKIPVLGRLLRVASSVFRGPERFDALFAENDLLKRKLEQEQARSQQWEQTLTIHGAELQRQMQAIELERTRVRVHSRLLEAMEARMRGWMGSAEEHVLRTDRRLDSAEERMRHTDKRLDSAEDSAEERMLHTDRRLDSAEERMRHTDKRLDSAEGRMAQHDIQFKMIFDGEPSFMNVVLTRLYTDHEVLETLNRQLSSHPTVWGDPARLHIADSAAVYTCLFNTNSGTITVGEYTFAGSRVSLLAGSHDQHLKGFLRRDAEITEGCDIVVGNGVWLASNCVLLGPCEVGDNAVIAAGAVVTPGTRVPANAIYGGVPARKIGELEFETPQDADNPFVIKALERAHGLLFIEGWTEKQLFPDTDKVGHWLCDKTGSILLERGGMRLRCRLNGAEAAELLVVGPEGECRITLRQGEETALELCMGSETPEYVTFRLENGAGHLFVMCATDSDKGIMNGGSRNE